MGSFWPDSQRYQGRLFRQVVLGDGVNGDQWQLIVPESENIPLVGSRTNRKSALAGCRTNFRTPKVSLL